MQTPSSSSGRALYKQASRRERFSKANEIRALYSFDTRQSNEPVQLLT